MRRSAGFANAKFITPGVPGSSSIILSRRAVTESNAESKSTVGTETKSPFVVNLVNPETLGRSSKSLVSDCHQ